MALYFPEVVRAIDVNTEAKRLDTVKFAPAPSAPKNSELSAEEVARRTAARPTTLPNDPEAIAALTEGERRVAEKKAREAEIFFQKVLARYPEQPRAWYGLGLVALLDHDGLRAKEVFGRLTAGEHAASNDPMVLAWSHIYLGRIYNDEGRPEQAKTEYQAALTIDGSPEQARQAAQKGLTESGREKTAERP